MVKNRSVIHCQKPQRTIIFACILLIFSLRSGIVFAGSQCLFGMYNDPQCRHIRKFTLTTSANVSTGKYGDPFSTTVAYFAETGRYVTNRGELSLTVPYLVRNGGGVTPEESDIIVLHTIANNANGIGDIALRGRYYWLEETDKFPSVDLVARIKFPTSSHDKGLGTGRADYTAGFSFLRSFGYFLGLLDTNVTVRRRFAESDLKPLRFDYSVGVGYLFTKKITGYFFVDGSTKSNEFSRSPLELTLSGSYRPKQIVGFSGYIMTGISDSSPDIGGGLSFSIHL